MQVTPTAHLILALACSKPALFRPMVHSPAFTFSSGYPLGFGFLAGLRLLVLRQFSAFLQALRRLGGAVFFRGLRPSSIWGFPFWLLWLTGQSSRPAFGRRLTFVRQPAQNPHYLSPWFIHRHLLSQAFICWVLGFLPGFALGCCASVKSFWPPALAQLALVAIIFQALHRLRGAVLFRDLRPSSIQQFLFSLLGLTVQSSRPAFGGRLTFVR